MNLMALKGAVIFGVILSSGIAFSLSIFVARLIAPNTLTDLIYFQSTSVFLAFVIQSGLRAGLRNQYYLGRRKIVSNVEAYIRRRLPWIAVPISILFLFQSTVPVYPAFSMLLALFTLLMGLRIAQQKRHEAALYSFFASVFIVFSSALIALANNSAFSARALVEMLSIIAIIALALKSASARNSGGLLRKVVVSSFGIQLSSFLIYLSVLLLAQYVILLAKDDSRVAVAYADVQVVCGIQLLILSRIIMIYEGFLVRGSRILTISTLLVIWGMVFSAGLYFAVSRFSEFEVAVAYLALSFAFLGRLPIDILSQFVTPLFRKDVYAVLMVASSGLLVVYMYRLEDMAAYTAIWLFSPAMASIALIMRAAYVNGDYFIMPSAR